MTDSHRPITSKARGICKYYTTERGCFNANHCKFLHSTEPPTDPSGSRPPLLTPYDQAKRCKYYAQGYCKRGDKCWFIHEKGVASATAADDDDDCCSICFESPSLYGLLSGCNHVFCIDCIRKWRDPSGKAPDSSNTKKCPMCRTQCRYIIPSSRFVKDGPDKERIIQNYKNSMARVPCKHFMTTKVKFPKKPTCPYGADCFYQHLKDDGTPYTFPYGADVAQRLWARQHASRRPPFLNFMSDGLDPLFGDEAAMAGSIDVAMDMFGRMLSQVMESSVEGHGAGRGLEGTRPGRRLVSALRAVHGLQDHDGDNIRPVIIPETMAPPNWDLEGDGDAVDNGWGWDEFADAVDDADIELMERLELLAENMLGSMRNTRGRDTPIPPLEPISIPRQQTPLPPLEPVNTGDAAQDDDDDDMPELQSVSNSSDSEDYDEGSDDDEPDHSSNHSSSADDLPPLERIAQTDEAHSPFSRRFSTVVEREREGTEDDETMNQQEHLSTQQAEAPQDSSVLRPVSSTPEVSETSPVTQDVPTLEITQPGVAPHPEPALEPSFVTDGRGRVVWSNKDSTETMPPSEPQEEPGEDVQSPPSSAARLFEWMTGFF